MNTRKVVVVFMSLFAIAPTVLGQTTIGENHHIKGGIKSECELQQKFHNEISQVLSKASSGKVSGVKTQ